MVRSATVTQWQSPSGMHHKLQLMNTYQLFIGANNTTGIVEKEKIVQVLSKYHDGFTLQDTVGYWKGKPEYSCIATIANVTEGDGITSIARELAQVLEQDAVGVTSTPSVLDFITPATE